MLVIISGRLSHNRKTKRQVTYQPDQGKTDTNRSMFDVFKDHKEKEEKRKQDLDRRFQEGLRNTASGWQYSYLEG